MQYKLENQRATGSLWWRPTKKGNLLSQAMAGGGRRQVTLSAAITIKRGTMTLPLGVIYRLS